VNASEKKTLETYLKYVFGTTKPKASRIEAALNRAHEIRQFEIKLYLQRNLYMWGLMLALFTAYGFFYQQIKNTTDFSESAFLFTVTGLGTFATIAWLKLEQASCSWQKNWEYHIEFLEYAFGENLHKTVIGKRFYFSTPNKIVFSMITAVYLIWGFLIHLSIPGFFNFLIALIGFGPLPRDNSIVQFLNLMLVVLIQFSFIYLIRIKGIWNTSMRTLPDNGAPRMERSLFHRRIPEIHLPRRRK
jgi:hypothetical protein